MQQRFPKCAKAVINFAADKDDGGQFSNTGLSEIRQNLLPVEVSINNARALPQSPTIDTLGFAAAAHPGSHGASSDLAWIQSEYVPSCVELIKQLTGADEAIHIFAPMQRTSDPALYTAPSTTAVFRAATAGFVHLDVPRGTGAQIAAGYGVKARRAAIFNIWKALSPPPQDMPLAVTDWHTVSEDDFVLGITAEGEHNMPYVTLVHSASAPKWYYYPDLTIDESLVFVGAHLDPGRPLGCAHTAFRQPDAPNARRRTSIEVRVLACFE